MHFLVPLLAFLLARPVLAADWWDDFTNNLATDLAPFIALLGERPAQQFLSESTTAWDYLIFAMAPLGIVTTVVSAIRVGGGPSLRAFIGRAQEGQRQVETELCSSTSADVCDMYSNGGITRVLGRPKILELVVDVKREDFEDCGERIRAASQAVGRCVIMHAKASIFTFRDYESVTRADDPRESKYQSPRGAFHLAPTWWRSLRRRLSTSTGNTRLPPEEEPKYAPNPNLSLNIWMRQPSPALLRLVAGTGLAIQLGVVLVAMVVTYSVRLEKEDGPAAPYAAPLMGIGTVSLAVGTFLCAYVIGEATHEAKFERSQIPKTELIILQPGGQVIGDQHFEAFAYNDHGTTRTYVSSSKPQSTKQGDWGVFVCVILTAGGFILQFVGLRDLHSSVAIAQLGATILMSAIRASLRTQRLSSSRNILRGIPAEGHELDWLVLHIGGKRASGTSGAGSGDTLTSESTLRKSPGARNSPQEDIESRAGAPPPLSGCRVPA